MKDLLKYFRNYKKETILGPFFKLLEASFELLVPLLIAHLVDQLIPRQDQGGIFGLVGLLFVFAGFGVLVAITAQYFSSKAAVGYTKELTNDLYEKILSLSKEQRDRLTTSSLVTRLTSDTYQIQTGINLFLRLFLRAPIVVFGSIFMAFTISPQLTLWFIGMVALLTLIIVLMSRLVNPLYARIRKITDRMVTITRQQLQGMRVIRAFGQAAHEEEEFNEVNQDYTKWQLVVSKWSSLISPLTFLVVNGTLICILWQGQASIQMGTLSQGMMVALVNYLLQILTELLKLAMLVTSLNQSYIAAGRIVQVFDEKSEELDQELDDVSVSDPQLALQIQDLVFTYPLAAKPSLEGIHLSINKGQTLGIIGGTGAGKSTLVQLLGHLYEASKGSLTIFKDGENPKTLSQWRDWVAVVPQKAELFKGSIRSNLMLGLNEEANEEQLWWALGVAQAADFVREKVGGLEAPVEAFGRNFSGGQRQRLTIARAVLRQAPFLVLDDSTSALDYLTEARLLQALKEELTETSIILISQRTNSLRSAEQILVLDKGRQVGLGSHEDLVATNPLYQEIHFSQQKREEGAE
ncbi:MULTISPECIES: ABC transporter ATP-binding protein [unclassified Streptococcus]|uniref:ABC transporter ATP-binding protein n=1 Tax=unclassified Streptococcus TaxID=2608887 RepID=UPI0010226C6D|nr:MULTISPECIES: ABC transporter ATP-binding protein [unclassified Streptococcus]MTQ41410.1 ATP-binding cassette domain-containing protein [Streptococcus sp. BIOML-A1]RYS60675.1 ABC transporter ATP-binding protein [Streptococcus sp. bf_0095]